MTSVGIQRASVGWRPEAELGGARTGRVTRQSPAGSSGANIGIPSRKRKQRLQIFGRRRRSRHCRCRTATPSDQRAPMRRAPRRNSPRSVGTRAGVLVADSNVGAPGPEHAHAGAAIRCTRQPMDRRRAPLRRQESPLRFRRNPRMLASNDRPDRPGSTRDTGRIRARATVGSDCETRRPRGGHAIATPFEAAEPRHADERAAWAAAAPAFDVCG